mmetsp:Transcript_93140/g.221569  ORF Transcript_93140/g.221569 Transcript_93140/m.221569 type:complete len:359 (+) Transcript_93140:46-1122(+)
MSRDRFLGYSCCLVAGVGFGVNYLPVKGIDTGDGIFFSAVMSVGILFVGLLTGMVLTSTPGLTMPVFEPWAAVGGAIWMCGNLMCPYIIKLIGMGLGLTVWDLSNMIIGWFTGHFGLFGVQKEHHKRPLENILGLGLSMTSLVFFSLAANADVTDAGDAEGPQVTKEVCDPENQDAACAAPGPPEELPSEVVKPAASRGPPMRGFGIGLAMALLAGVLFGMTFDLPTGLMQGNFGSDHSSCIMDYVFSHFCGILCAALVALVIYGAARREKCYMPLRMVWPAIASGVLWGIAQVAWFQANIELGFSVAFPIIGSLPGIVGLVIGVAFLGEVKSRGSRIWAALGLALRLPGVILIAVSS